MTNGKRDRFFIKAMTDGIEFFDTTLALFSSMDLSGMKLLSVRGNYQYLRRNYRLIVMSGSVVIVVHPA